MDGKGKKPLPREGMEWWFMLLTALVVVLFVFHLVFQQSCARLEQRLLKPAPRPRLPPTLGQRRQEWHAVQ